MLTINAFLCIYISNMCITGVVLDVDTSTNGSDSCIAVHGISLEGCHRIEGEILRSPVGMLFGDLVLGAFPVFLTCLHTYATLEIQVPIWFELGRDICQPVFH